MALGAAAIVIAGLAWMRFGSPGAGSPLRRLPTRDATVGQVDVAAIRSAGFAPSANAGALHEPEYEDFIKRSGFNWEKDLDRLTWSFTATAKYFVVEGRFDWSKLDAFVKAEGGECRDDFCTVRGSQPGREISFFRFAPRDGAGGFADATRRTSYGKCIRLSGHPLSSHPTRPCGYISASSPCKTENRNLRDCAALPASGAKRRRRGLD